MGGTRPGGLTDFGEPDGQRRLEGRLVLLGRQTVDALCQRASVDDSRSLNLILRDQNGHKKNPQQPGEEVFHWGKGCQEGEAIA